MSKKKRTVEFKLKVVLKYLEGEYSLQDISEEFSCDKSSIRKWKDAYLQHGIDGLTTLYKTYTGDFKAAVVEYMKNTGTSARQTAAHFNVPNHSTIKKWERIYYEQGKEALYLEHRGRGKKMVNPKKEASRKKALETNEDLLGEVQRLRMENEYLKKLNALIQEEEKLRLRKK